MEIGKTLSVHQRRAWRAWLRKHYRTEPEVWLVLPKKSAGEPSLSYNDAVEEALCFGWIDSIVKQLDDDHRAQRYSLRRKGSPYSQPNKERLWRMLQRGRVAADVRAALPDDIDPTAFRFPPDIMRALQANKEAWGHFQTFSESYQRIRVAWVDAARAVPEEFVKRLENLIRKTEQGKRFGVGIESYY